MLNDIVDISVRHSVIHSKITYDKACVHVVVDEAGKKCRWFVQMDFGLRSPVWVSCFEPSEVVMGNGCDGFL